MITVEQAQKNTELMLRFYNTFRKKPISLEELKQENQYEFEKKRPWNSGSFEKNIIIESIVNFI